MKKSNKLLLAGFLLLVFIIIGIHMTLYAKYKNGEYTIYNREDFQTPLSMESFAGIKFISVRNVHGATIKFGDTAEVEKGFENRMQYTRYGDTLVITGKDFAGQRIIRDRITFTLPYNATLSVFNSSFTFKTDKKSAEINTVIYLQKSAAIFSGNDNPFQAGYMKVVASDSSVASFHGNTQINNLEVRLSGSTIDYGEGDFNQLSIITDSISRISLQTKHLLKAKITTIGND
jgi:hypothetical protein